MITDRIPPNCRLRCTPGQAFLDISVPEAIRLRRCGDCGVVFEDPRPAPERIKAFYDDAALWTRSTDAEGKPRSYVNELEAKTPVFRDLVRRIERFKRSGRVLDVGCGAGLLERVLDRTRWQTLGIDLSPFIADFGRREFGAHIVDGRFETLGLPEAPYDVVVMKYVLDHMEEPDRALARAREVLRPDGLLVLGDLINIDSPCARLFGPGHRLLHPMHFTYFSPRSIRLHLDRAGFRVVKIDFPFFRTPYFTGTNLRTMAVRTARRVRQILVGGGEVIPSPPFYGNMMDVFAVPR